MNSAETFVDIISRLESRSEEEDSYSDRLVTWVSESGVMEFFIFGASASNGGPKTVSRKMAVITGFPVLPPYFSLGFQYSKWEYIDTDSLIALVDRFEANNLPVDVLWMDIAYTDGNKYFEFDQSRFYELNLFTEKMEALEKKVVVITDPHIKVDDSFFVY